MLQQASTLRRLRLLTIVLLDVVLVAYEALEHYVLTPTRTLSFLFELALFVALVSVLLYALFGALIRAYTRLQDSYREVLSLRSYQQCLLESAPYAIVAVDAADRITSLNEQARLLSGRSSGEVVGADVAELFDDGPAVKSALEAARLHGSVESIRETRLVNARGATIPVSVTCRTVQNGRDAAQGCVLILDDLRERKRLQRRLIMSERLAAATQLAVGFAHQLRNPLASIGVNLANLEHQTERSDSPEERDRLLGVISADIQRIDRLVDGFLRYAVADGAGARRVRCRVDELVDAALEQCRGSLTEKRVDPVVRLPADGPYVEVDPRQIIQALAGIIENAVEAVSESGRVEITVRGDGEFALVEVRDLGCGIPPENLDRVVDFCFSTKTGGLGIGLSFAALAAEQHGGGLEIESEPGEGTRVLVRLPAANAEA